MANSWLRLWHEMPNDPKWKTIARVSKQPISLVLSLFMHMLVSASQNVTRGHVDVTAEDLASALDVTEDQINAILSAMEGRVKEGNELSGWSQRQPKKEDVGDDFTGAKSSVQRKREQRERQKESECHDKSRNVTTDKDKDKELKEAEPTVSGETASDPKVLIFSHGVEILKRHGSSESSARSFLGKYAGCDEIKLAGVIGHLMAQPKIEPKAYIVAAMTPKKRELVL